MSTAAVSPMVSRRLGIVGVYWFLASEAALFSGLLLAVVSLRGEVSDWSAAAGQLSAFHAGLGTVCLLGATVWLRFASNGNARQRSPLVGVIIAGALFLSLKLHDYVEHWNAGFRPDSGLFWASFYLLTSLHALHVLAGSIVAVWCAWEQFRPPRHLSETWVQGLRLYWYLVDGVWLCLLLLFYAV